MKKTVVIYDKWLHSLGGGEVVACTMARVLKDAGHDVIFAAGKIIPPYTIKKALDIDLSDIRFEEVWNDEIKLKKLASGKDLFINVSFMDYSYAYAKRNIYYTHFPTESYLNVQGWIFNNYILPISSKLMKPLEFIDGPEVSLMKNGHYMHSVSRQTRIAFSYLVPGEVYLMKFSVFLENFTKQNLESYDWLLEKAHVIKREVVVNHHQNVINYNVYLNPEAPTIYFTIRKKGDSSDPVYLLYPKIIPFIMPDFIYRFLFEKLNSRLRAGVFNNILQRLGSYDTILANSEYTKKWIRTYWRRESTVLYPPVQVVSKQVMAKEHKKNWIVNVGRFFTLGHGKRQEILISAFKKLYAKRHHDWQLHLAGGLGNEPTSLVFAAHLKKKAKGYPIFFHFNVSRKKLENLLASSKIYWHATGYHEDEKKRPIKFEHFGIAAVEGTSAGCIPILYRGGGLPEIVHKLGLSDKHLFTSIDDLVRKSSHIITDLNQKNNVIKNHVYQRLKKIFSQDSFDSYLRRIVWKKIKM